MYRIDDSLVRYLDTSIYYPNIIVNGTTMTDKVESLEYTGYANSDGALTIGNVCASSIRFTIYDPQEVYTGKTLNVRVGFYDSEKIIHQIPLGVFTCVKPEINGKRYTYTAYDYMVSKLETTFYPSEILDTDKKVLTAIEEQTEVPIIYNEDSFIEHHININRNYTCRELIGYLAALQGWNAKIDRLGNVNLGWYNQTSYSLLDNKIYEDGFISSDEGEYEVQYIRMQFQREDGTYQYESGSGEMGIGVENPFATQEICDEVFNRIGGFKYRIASAEFKGDLRLDVGDVVSVTSGGNTYSVPIMMINHYIDGGLRSNIASYGKTNAESEYLDVTPQSKYQEKVGAMISALSDAVIDKLSVDDLATKELTASNLHIDGGSIDLNDGAFSVDEEGSVTASDVHITGGNLDFETTVQGQPISHANFRYSAGKQTYETNIDAYGIQVTDSATQSYSASIRQGKINASVSVNGTTMSETRIDGATASFGGTMSVGGVLSSADWISCANGKGVYIKDLQGDNRTAISMNTSGNWNVCTGGKDSAGNDHTLTIGSATGTSNVLLRGSGNLQWNGNNLATQSYVSSNAMPIASVVAKDSWNRIHLGNDIYMCFRRRSVTISSMTAWGNSYYGVITKLAMPSGMTTLYLANASLEGTKNGYAGWLGVVGANDDDSATNTSQFGKLYFLRPNYASGTSYKIIVNYFVIAKF